MLCYMTSVMLCCSMFHVMLYNICITYVQNMLYNRTCYITCVMLYNICHVMLNDI